MSLTNYTSILIYSFQNLFLFLGQMTAYYLHMANHKKYKYMDLTPEQLKASNGKKAATGVEVTKY